MFSSQMTFMYFDDMNRASIFFEDFLELKCVFDPGWAKIYQVSQGAFLGAVDCMKGSLHPKHREGTLISLTVTDVENWHLKAEKWPLDSLSPIKNFEDLGLKSFFFKGPEGYDFEIQQFYDSALMSKF